MNKTKREVRKSTGSGHPLNYKYLFGHKKVLLLKAFDLKQYLALFDLIHYFQELLYERNTEHLNTNEFSAVF